nr:MAG TPA: hypothetical protein [Caudoviricetes sp.]
MDLATRPRGGLRRGQRRHQPRRTQSPCRGETRGAERQARLRSTCHQAHHTGRARCVRPGRHRHRRWCAARRRDDA